SSVHYQIARPISVAKFQGNCKIQRLTAKGKTNAFEAADERRLTQMKNRSAFMCDSNSVVLLGRPRPTDDLSPATLRVPLGRRNAKQVDGREGVLRRHLRDGGANAGFLHFPVHPWQEAAFDKEAQEDGRHEEKGEVKEAGHGIEVEGDEGGERTDANRDADKD